METAQTRIAKEGGIAKADRGVSQEWRAQAAAAIATILYTHVAFSSDDVRLLLIERGHVPSNWCAVGPAMRRAEKAGWIERCGVRGLSQFASTHSAESKLWRRRTA
jgi:hypothetical protein